MTAFLLQAPKISFSDANGYPLVAGTIDVYSPGTTMRKDTWQDRDKTILNTNPIVLDARGEAIVFGEGTYRFIVRDVLGNLIYDQITDVSLQVGPAGPGTPGVTIIPNLDVTGATDVSSLINAALASIQAAGGGTLALPIGKLKIGSTLSISASGVKIRGSGRGAPHDIEPLSAATTQLIWAGANGGTLIQISPIASSTAQKLADVEVSACALISGAYPYDTAAAYGILMASTQNSLIDVSTYEFKTAAIATTTVTPLGEAGNCEGNTISLRFRQINTSGTALQLGGNTNSNTCHNTFPMVWGYINSGIGIDFQDADNNRLEQVWIDRIQGGTGVNLFFRAAGGSRGFGGGRTNVLEQFSQSVHSGLIYCEGTETVGVATPSYANRIVSFDSANTSITTQIGTGASFFWSSNLFGEGVREAVTNQYEGHRQRSDGLIEFWGSGSGFYGTGQQNRITLPFGCSRILYVFGNALTTDQAAAPNCIPESSGNSFILFSPYYAQYTYHGLALA